jgi:ABC-type amino acid transport substrate-binding protein
MTSTNLSGGWRVRHPYERAMLTVGRLVGLFAIPAAVLAAVLALGRQPDGAWAALLMVGSGLFAFMALIWVIVWLWGLLQMRRIRAFMASDRPLIRWTYTTEEWAAFKNERWDDERSDWKVAFGCLAIIFALVGLLVGGMIGLDDDLAAAIGGALLGALAGGAIGALIGGTVAWGNHLGARRDLARANPDPVVLGNQELYMNGDYFRGHGTRRYVREAQLEPGPPLTLSITVLNPKPRGGPEETWQVPVPERFAREVETVLPYLVGTQSVREAPHPGDLGEGASSR